MRDTILSVFGKCYDTENLTLVNLLENYVLLVLSIHSIIFKCCKYELYCLFLLHCCIKFVMFYRHHYNKALLATLSLFLHWQGNGQPLFETSRLYLLSFNEYPGESFPSVLKEEQRRRIQLTRLHLKQRRSIHVNVSCILSCLSLYHPKN